MKRLFGILVAVICFSLFIFILAGLPFFHQFIKSKIETAIESALGETNQVHIGSLRGNLFYVVEIDKFSVDDIIKINNLKVSYNVFKLLSKEIAVNSLVIDGLSVDINRIETITKNFQAPAEEIKEKKETPFVICIKELSISNSNLFGVLNNQLITASINIQGALLSKVLIIDRLLIKTDESTITAYGRISIKEDADFNLTYNIDLLLDEFNIQGLYGTTNGTGKIVGNTSSPKIQHETRFDIEYQNTQYTGSAKIDWQTPDFDKLNCEITAMVEIPMPAENKEKEEKWDLVLSIKEKDLLCNLSSSYGNASLQGIIQGNLENPQFHTTLTGKFKFGEFTPMTKGFIEYNNNKLEIKDFQIIDDDLSVQLNALMTTDDPSIIASDILITCNDIGILNNFFPTPQPLKGKFNISTKIKGSRNNPDIVSKIQLVDIHLYGEKIEQGDLCITLKDHVVYCNPGSLQSPRGTICFSGSYNIKQNTFGTHMHSDGITFKSPEVFGSDTMPVSGHVYFDMNFEGNLLNPTGKGKVFFSDFVYDSLRLDTCKLTFALKDSTVNLLFSDERNSVHLDANIGIYKPYSFNTILTFEHFDLTNYIISDVGFITGQFSAQGEVNQPDKIVGKIQIESLYVAVEKNEFQNADDIMIDVRDSFINIKSCMLRHKNDSLSLYGTLPLDPGRGDVKLICRSSKIDIAQLTAMLPRAPEITGFLAIDLNISGKLRTPDINGFLHIENFQYTGSNILIDSVYSMIKFKNKTIAIDHFTGKVNNGIFSCTGFANFSQNKIDTMNINFLCEGIDFKQNDFGSAILTSTVQVTAKNDSFKIDGELTIDKAIYDAPFNLQSIIGLLTRVNRPSPKQSESLRKIFCNIGISTPNGIEIMNNVADVAVDLDLQLKGYLSKLNAYGTIWTSEGTIHYLGKKFKIVNAIIEFDNPYKIDPVLDLEAYHTVSSDNKQYEIFMYVSGTTETWRLTLESNPKLPEQDIISLLLIGRRRPGTYASTPTKDINLKSKARDYAMGLARGEIARRAEKTLGMEKVTITGDLFDPKTLDIGIEKKFGKRLTFIYGTGIESWELRKVGINYDITNNISIYTLYDQENLNSSVDFDFHFNIK